MSNPAKTSAVWAASLGASLVLVGCGGSAKVTSDPGSHSDVLSSIAAREAMIDRANPPSSLAEALPNQIHHFEGHEPYAYSELAVVGHITKVLPGKAFLTDGLDDDNAMPETEFDNPEAAMRIALVELAVDRGVGQVPETVTFGMSIGASTELEDFESDLKRLGTVVALLEEKGAYSALPAHHWVQLDGALLGQVDTQSRISFPGLGESSKQFVGELDTVERMLAEGTETKPPIDH